jgi:DNA invertase Pin-like site-specific DNA recombinase
MVYAEYIRESTADQADRYGPGSQRRLNAQFAQQHGLRDSGLQYEEYASGKTVSGRSVFLQALSDLKAGKYRVLLVAYPDRLTRNTHDFEDIKAQVRDAGGVIVYTDSGMISGQRNTALAETVFHYMGEQYIDVLSGHVTDGLREKFASGGANGVPPLGTKHIYVRHDGTLAQGPERNTRAMRVLNEEQLPTLRALFTHYVEAGSSRKTAEWLNVQDYRNREGQPFTQDSIKETIRNPYYGPDEVVIYHKGDIDEERRPTPKDEQIFPDDIHELWLRCQEKKDTRSVRAAASTRSFVYPLHEMLRCATCQSTYNGQPTKTAKGTYRHSVHKARGVECAKPGQVKTDEFESQILEMLTYVKLPRNWQSQIKRLLGQPRTDEHANERKNVQAAMERVKKMYQWGDMDDEEFRKESRNLQDQLDSIPLALPIELVAYRLPAELLRSVGNIVGHRAIRHSAAGCACKV